MILRIISVVLLLGLVVSGAAAQSGINICVASDALTAARAASFETLAQASACVPPDALTAARAACDSAAVGQVCLGAGEVQAAPGSGLVIVGETVDLAAIDRLSGSGGSLALLKLQADLPETAAQIQLVLYGSASIANAVTGLQPPFPTLTVKNGPANILNLRAAPSTDAAVVTTMKWNQELTADGRSSDGQWLRVQTENGAAWVFASLVKVQQGGEVATLYALDSPITQHMQGITLTSATESCGGGLLVQAANHDPAHLEVNGALLTFSTATLLLQAQQDTALTVAVLDGGATVAADGETVEARTGAQVQIASGAAPHLQDRYAFAPLVSAPLDLLPQGSLACVAGVNSGSAALYSAPGASQAAGELTPDASATVTGQTTVDGTAYWQVGLRWVKQSDVQTAGVCTAIPQVSAAAQQQTSQAASFPHDLLPDGRSIWQAHTGVDNLFGTCTAPPIAQCDHLAAVTPQPNGTISWLGQEPAPYTLRPTGANTFSFSGRNQLNNANLSLSVTFTSPTTWVGTMRLVYDNDAACTHTFNYTAERIR